MSAAIRPVESGRSTRGGSLTAGAQIESKPPSTAGTAPITWTREVAGQKEDGPRHRAPDAARGARRQRALS